MDQVGRAMKNSMDEEESFFEQKTLRIIKRIRFQSRKDLGQETP